MSTMLEGLGIPVMQGYEPSTLNPAPDCVIIGNALSRGNPEVEETLEPRVCVYRSAAEVIKEEFIRGRRSLVVAGHARQDDDDEHRDVGHGARRA